MSSGQGKIRPGKGNESKFNGVYSRRNLIESAGTHWIALYVNANSSVF